MAQIDTVIIGAGVVGLASALSVARRGRSVCVLERHPRPGTGTSTRNSQVIHAGLYYPAGSLKAKHCVDGARRLYEFCEHHHVPFAQSGKLVVASQASEIGALEQLKARGDANGVPGLEIVDQSFVSAREPHVRAVAALYSPYTGIVDAEALVRTLARLCVDEGAILLTHSPMIGGGADTDRISVQTPAETIVARSAVNAAGLHADEASNALGGGEFRIYPCRGEYAEVMGASRALVNGLVYPLPHTHSLGVHVTRTVQGAVMLGPTATFQESRDDYENNRLPIEAFFEPARHLIPELSPNDLRQGGAGIRPKLHPPDVAFADFLIERDKKCPRLVQAAGIESPGLTACLAIGEHVASLVDEVLS